MNIQFMDREHNEVKKVNYYYGEKDEFVPNWDELIKNASCDDEIKMLNECKERNSSFAFEIVYTIFTRVLDYDLATGNQEWVSKWTIYQHPWYENEDGKVSKEEMMEEVERFYNKERVNDR